MSVIVARTRNSTYVIDSEARTVSRHDPHGRRTWTASVSDVLSLRPLCEEQAHVSDATLVRGPEGQALVLMTETRWVPRVGLPMLLRTESAGHVLTTPVISASLQEIARAA